MALFSELKRRNVLRVGAAYVVTAWLIIQVAETIFPLYGFGDAPARIVVTVLAIGFIPALVFSWVFEITPEGLMRESELAAGQSATARTGKTLDRAIMVLLVAGLAYFAFDKFVLGPQRDAAMQDEVAKQVEQARQAGRTEALLDSYGDNSIVVLPFVNMSSDPEQEYFSDGIAEELLNLLSRIEGLRVISRSSAFAFKGQRIDIPKIAQELNVAHVLEGSVRRSGNQVRITVQLIDARTDTHLWSESYDRSLHDIFAIQDEVATSVVEQLKVELRGEAPKSRQVDPQAYALYIQARHLMYRGTPDGFEQAIPLYQQSLQLDPEQPAAWVGLGKTYANQVHRFIRPREEGLSLARNAIDNALDIDPDFGPAHALLGSLALFIDGDQVIAAQHYQRALEFDPADVTNLHAAAILLDALGRFEEAISVNEYLAARDPLSLNIYYGLGLSHLKTENWGPAVEAFQTALRLSPDALGLHFNLGIIRYYQGQRLTPVSVEREQLFQAALELFNREQHQAFRLIGLVIANYQLGNTQASDASLAELIGKHQDDVPYYIAFAYGQRDEFDLAFEWLEKAAELGDPELKTIGLRSPNQEFDNMRNDPRWLEFLAQHPPPDLANIPFEVKLPGS